MGWCFYRTSFDKTTPSPGYIKGYPRSAREWGPSIPHAAMAGLWPLAKTVMAPCSEYDAHAELRLNMHAIRSSVALWDLKPYVVAGRSSLPAGRVGQGGWSWYTGSAAWSIVHG